MLWTVLTCTGNAATSCICDIEWDGDHPVRPTLLPAGFIRKCLYHQALTDDAALDAVVEENIIRKQIVWYALARIRNRIKNAEVMFSYDADRVMNVTIAGITAPQRNALQNAADNLFGANKVKVV